MSELERIAEAERTMRLAVTKAPGDPTSFAPYLRAAINLWRLRAEAAQQSDDASALVEATTERIICEDHFREITGRSFHLVEDAISYADVLLLPTSAERIAPSA